MSQDAPPELDPQISALVGSLLQAEGWSLIVSLFADLEGEYIRQIRMQPVGQEAQTAAVKLAHIEELRDTFRSATPQEYGDPFDATSRPGSTRDGREREHSGGSDDLTIDEDDYDLGDYDPDAR